MLFFFAFVFFKAPRQTQHIQYWEGEDKKNWTQACTNARTETNGPVRLQMPPKKMFQLGLDCSSDFPSLRLIIRQGCCWRLGTDEDLAVSGEHLGREGEGGGGGAGVNERQTPVVPTQLFSQSSSKASRTSRSTGNLRRVLPLFAVARRLVEGWKCLQWGTTSKPFAI